MTRRKINIGDSDEKADWLKWFGDGAFQARDLEAHDLLRRNAKSADKDLTLPETDDGERSDDNV